MIQSNYNKLQKFVLLLLLATTTWNANAIPFTTEEKNAESMHEVLLSTSSMLQLALGSSKSTLNYSGNFSDSSWTAGLSGTYGANAVDLSFSGTFDQVLDEGSFSSTGTVGDAAWNGSGSWSFSDVDPQSVNMVFDAEVLYSPLLNPFIILDWHTVQEKLWARTEDANNIYTTDFGTYQLTLFGIPIGPKYNEISDWVEPKNGDGTVIVSMDLIDEMIYLDGQIDFNLGEIEGQIHIPEPSVISLILLGVLGLLYTPYYRSKQPGMEHSMHH